MTDIDIDKIIVLYAEEAVAEEAPKIARDLKADIRKQLKKGHGYDTGQLYRDIYSRYTTSKTMAVITAGYTVEYGQYVDKGHKLRNGNWWEGYGFMEAGLKATLENYK